MHRHTDISWDGNRDGSLNDSYRYAMDPAAFDYLGVCDHQGGESIPYNWWRLQKAVDLYTIRGHFTPVYSYERSLNWPNGHRNVIMPKRGIRPLPRGDTKSGTAEKGTPDTKVLYAYLKHFGGICASHTSATNMGTDWRDNDPDVEPVVEIYQGHRHNYELPGAPRSPTRETQIGGFEPDGFINLALKDKGYKLGFQ